MIFPPPAKPAPAARAPWPFRAGKGCLSTPTPMGHMVSVGPGSKWRHPWFTRLTWVASSNSQPGSGKWVATVRAGFVNGRAPVVRVTMSEAQTDAGADFGINPLSGQPYFSDPIFKQQQAQTTATSSIINIPLYMNPAIVPTWRAVGWDSFGTAAPAFFAQRGVNPPSPTGGISLNGEPVNVSDSTPPKGNRLLRAAQIILHQPRQALTSTITLQPGIASGLSNVTQTLGLRSAAPGDALKVFSGVMVDAAALSIDPLAGDYEEPNFDEILIATVYLLSPPDALPGSVPDATWQPFVKHSLFWNLTYLTPNFEITTADLANPFAAITQIAAVLGGGTGSIAVNFVTASMNDMAAQAMNLIKSHSMAGDFFTPTGGGSTSLFPSMPSPQSIASTPSNGLDKPANLAAKRLAEARAQRLATLDPAFPSEGRAFPVAYLR